MGSMNSQKSPGWASVTVQEEKETKKLLCVAEKNPEKAEKGSVGAYEWERREGLIWKERCPLL